MLTLTVHQLRAEVQRVGSPFPYPRSHSTLSSVWLTAFVRPLHPVVPSIAVAADSLVPDGQSTKEAVRKARA